MFLRPKHIAQEGAVPGQALTWNGSQWVPANSVANLYAPTGFPNRTDSTISRNDAAPRQFTIAPAVTSFSFYANGFLFTKNAAQNKTWSNTEGLHYFYFDDSGVLQETTVFTDDLLIKYCVVAILYWDAANSVSILFADERHGYVMSNQTHLHLHLTLGCQWISGLALNNLVVDGDGSLATHAEFGVDSGEVHDEDLECNIPGTSGQSLALPAQIPVLWRTGASGNWRKKTADNYPLIYSGSGGYVGPNGRAAWNQYTGGAWQLTEVGQGQCVLVHYFGTNNKSEPVVAILGQAVYANVTDARNAAEDEISSILYGNLPVPEFTPIASVIFQTSTTYTNAPKARIRSVNATAQYIDFRSHKFAGSAGSSIQQISNIGCVWTLDGSSVADADPGNKLARMNNANQSLATYLYLDNLIDCGVDISYVLLRLKINHRLLLQQNDDVTKNHLFRITDNPTDGTGYVKVPIVSESTSGSIGDAKKFTIFVLPCRDLVVFNDQVGVSYTLALSDMGKMVTLNNANPVSLIVPKNAVVPFPIGTQIDLEQKGGGKVTVAPVDGTVTINSDGGNLSLAAQWVGATLVKTDTDVWTLFGNLIP